MKFFGIKEGDQLSQFSRTFPVLALEAPYAPGQTGMTSHPRVSIAAYNKVGLLTWALWTPGALGVSTHKSPEFIHSILCI